MAKKKEVKKECKNTAEFKRLIEAIHVAVATNETHAIQETADEAKAFADKI